MDHIRINARLEIPVSELSFSFDRSPGPGGQNVNKLNTRVELCFNVRNSGSITEPQRVRIVEALGRRLSSEGLLRIRSSRYRTQLRNKQDCIDKLAAKLAEALKPPPAKRRETRPSRAELTRQREAKRRNSAKKRLRKRPDLE